MMAAVCGSGVYAGVPTDALAVPQPVGSRLGTAIRRGMGLCSGDLGFTSAGDLNQDGCINVLDLAMSRRGISPHDEDRPDGKRPNDNLAGVSERIVVESQTTLSEPGATLSVLFLIRDNSTGLMGYSLDVTATPNEGATGTVTANIASTNFYEKQNLIAAYPGGAELDPFFSVIIDGGDGSVFVNAITEDNSTVTASDNINDVFAQVFFDVSADASGTFTIQLGPASALSDGDAFPVAFDFEPGTILVEAAVPPVVTSIGPRYLELLAVPGETPIALLVTSPDESCISLYVQAPNLINGQTIGRLDAQPVFLVPSEWSLLYVSDEAILPATSYSIQSEFGSGALSEAAFANTWSWADANNSGGDVDFDDILCILDAFAGDFPGECGFFGADLEAGLTNVIIDFDDILAALNAFSGEEYLDNPAHIDPCP